MKRCSWIIELHNNKDRTYRKGQNKIHFTDKRTTFYLFKSNYSFRIDQIVIKNKGKKTRCSKTRKKNYSSLNHNMRSKTKTKESGPFVLYRENSRFNKMSWLLKRMCQHISSSMASHCFCFQIQSFLSLNCCVFFCGFIHLLWFFNDELWHIQNWNMKFR